MNSHEFDWYAPLAQCALGLVAALSILERAVVKKTGTTSPVEPLTYKQFEELAEGVHLKVRVKGELRKMSDYFRKPLEDPVRLDGRSKYSQAIMDALEELMRELVTDRFYASGAPLHGLRNNRRDFDDLTKLTDAFWQFSERGRFKAIWKRCNNSLRTFVKLARQEVGWVPNPDFPSLDIFDVSALKSEFHFLYDAPDDNPNPNCGLFAVIRESRGPVAPEGQSYILAREVLWLAPKNKIREPERDIPGFYGFYVSASDPDVFLIESLLPENGTIILNGTARGSEGTQRFTLIFEAFRGGRKLQFVHGVLAGIAGGSSDRPSGAGGARDKPSIGAWRTVVIRPDWDVGLDRLLYDCQKTEAKKVRSIVFDRRFATVLSSGGFSQEERLAFRRLIANKLSLVASAAKILEASLLGEIEKRARRSGHLPGMDTKNLVNILVGVIREQWHILDPAQLLNFGAQPHAGHQTDLKRLLALEAAPQPA
jgi:hypothetical protein